MATATMATRVFTLNILLTSEGKDVRSVVVRTDAITDGETDYMGLGSTRSLRCVSSAQSGYAQSDLGGVIGGGRRWDCGCKNK